MATASRTEASSSMTLTVLLIALPFDRQLQDDTRAARRGLDGQTAAMCLGNGPGDGETKPRPFRLGGGERRRLVDVEPRRKSGSVVLHLDDHLAVVRHTDGRLDGSAAARTQNGLCGIHDQVVDRLL